MKIKGIFADLVLLISRLGLAAMILTLHAWPKFDRYMELGKVKFSDPIGIGEVPSFLLALGTETICSILIALGLKTRWAVIPLIFTLAVAGFIHHAPDPFPVKEKALVYVIAFLLLWITGPGKISLDYSIWGRRAIS